MGGTALPRGPGQVKRFFVLNILFCCILCTSSSFAADNAAYLTQWMELLTKGNAKEKKFALDNLWFLQNPQYRTDSRILDPILKALKDNDPSVREAAASFLKTLGERTHGCCGEAGIVPALYDAFRDERAAVRAEAAKALGYYKDSRVVDALIEGLKDPDIWVRLNVINSLGAYLGERESMVYTETRGGERKRKWLGYTWGDSKVETAVGMLVNMLNEESQWQNMFIQQECVRTLGRIGTQDKRAIAVLLQKSNVNYLKRDIAKALGKMQALEAEEFLINGLKDQDSIVRMRSLYALSQLPIDWSVRNNSAVIDSYKAQSHDSFQEVRAYVAFAIGKIGGKSALSGLREALKDESELVVSEALKGMKNIIDSELLVDYIDLFGSKNKQISDTAMAQFKTTAKLSMEQFAYVFRLKGSKDVVRKQEKIELALKGLIISTDSIPEKFNKTGYQTIKRYVHPAAAGKLVDLLKKSDSNAKLNALEVITLFEDDKIEQVLLDLIDDKLPLVSRRAITLLGQYGSSKSVPRLIQILKASDQNMKLTAINALADIADIRAEEPVRNLLTDKDPEVRAAAMRCLDRLGQKDAVEMAISVLITRPSREQVLAAIGTIKRTHDMRAVEPLIVILQEKKREKHIYYEDREIAVLLGDLGDKRAVEPLLDMLSWITDQGAGFLDSGMKYDIIDALVKLKDKRAVPLLIRILGSKDAGIKERSIAALSAFRDPSAVPGLIRTGSETRFTQMAVTALGHIGDPAALDYLEKLLADYKPKDYSAFIIRAIGEIKSERSVDLLVRYLLSPTAPNSSDRDTIEALIKQENKKAIKPILKYAGMTDGNPKCVPVHMIEYEMKKYGVSQIRQILRENLYNDDKDIRVGTISVLGEMGERQDLFLLEKLATDADPQIQGKAVAAIKRLRLELDKKN